MKELNAPSQSMRERVRARLNAESEERIGSSEWLNDNATFDDGRRLKGSAISKAEALFEILTQDRRNLYNIKKKKIDAEILCANLLLNGRRKPIAISLSRNSYRSWRYARAGRFTIDLVSLMREKGYIEIKKGYHSNEDGRMTRIWATQKLLDFFGTSPELDFDPVDLVNLRDENNNPVDYKDTRETNRIRNVLRSANIVNRAATVQLQTGRSVERLHTDLYCVFTRSWDEHGRLYNRGLGPHIDRRGYHGLRKNERANIWINHERTVELDFSGMQPRMLYASVGIQYNDDPYTAIIKSLAEHKHASPALRENAEELRDFLKKLMFALINAKSLSAAVSSGNKKLHEDRVLREMLKTMYLKSGRLKRPLKVAWLIKLFKNEHSPIVEHFHKSIGLELMLQDAKIALDVIEHFTKQGKPILAIHDSFIVQERYKDELRTAMQKAYAKNTGGFSCPIK